LPVPAYNTFNEVFDSLESFGEDLTVPFKSEVIRPDEFVAHNWPAQPGDYSVFNATKSIGLALLKGVDIDDPSLAKFFSSIAIAGSITTENLGVEHLVKNVIANPYMRHLVLWGDDVEGHLPGDALLSLSAKGLDRGKRIIGAHGARPVLKNLTESEVSHFRKQIELNDLIGRKDISALASQLKLLNNQAAQPYEAGLKVDLVEVRRANPAKRLTLDPLGYFVIMVMKGKEYPLLVEHYSNDGRLRNMIEGKDAASICATLIDQQVVSQLDHAAYLGRELVKAEMSLISASKYIQDRAQGKVQSD
jgi:tetrahydromethanopterin S-methyltransferase subunit A